MTKGSIWCHLGGGNSLRRRTIFGSGCLLARSIALGGIDLIRTVVFVRILAPDDYGLMALTTMATGFLNSFTFLGLEVLIQRDGDNYRERLPYYWTIKAFRGLLLLILAYSIAAPIAKYYNNPQLIPLIRFLGLSFLFAGCSGFGQEVCQRTMNFSKSMRYEVVGSIVVLIVGIICLFALRNVWALALYTVFTAAAQCVTSYLMFHWRPNIRFSRDIGRQVLVFSGSIIMINILNYIFNNFDRGVIGKLLDLQQLGYYARANFLALIPATYFVTIMAPVFMPAFRPIVDDPVRLKRAFLKVLVIYTLFYSCVGTGLFIFAEPFILILYGKKWLPVLPVFRILLIYGISKGIMSVCPSIFFLKGKPWLISLSTFVMVGCFCVLCIPATIKFHLIGTAWSVVIAALISHGISLILVFTLMHKSNNSPQNLARQLE